MAALPVVLAVVIAATPTALHAATGSPVPTRTMHVTAAQLLHVADVALSEGDQTTARRAYNALMRDPSSDIQLEARFRLAMLESKQGNLTQAALLLREVVDRRPSATRARLELAGLLDRMGDKEAAWREIRAIHAGGLPPAVARLIDRYSEALRTQRPFGASFEMALAPDSNINRATRSDTLGTVLGDFQIAKDGKAKSGTGLSVHVQAYRRLSLGADAGLLFRLTGFANLYRQKQFNDIAADFAVGPELNLGRNRLQLEVGATQRWYGQKPFMRSARIAGTLSHPLGSRTLLRLGGS
ncbi:MAG: tetratricopeptide repeat protein, partial [Sphingomicrobium sp.]